MAEGNGDSMSGGPYFPGQEPTKCGHYHPDSMRLRDELRGKKLIRVCKCIHCGIHEVTLNINKMAYDPQDLRNLQDVGFIIAQHESEFDANRERELWRFRATKITDALVSSLAPSVPQTRGAETK